MSESLNVNVLVAAKDEYTKQLVTALQPKIYDVLKGIFIESQIENKKSRVSYSKFQKELKGVPNWTEYKLEEKVKRIKESFPYLMDLITAIFVSHVKILACVRLSPDDKSIKIKVPNLNTFLHKIIINLSEKVYYAPHIIDNSKEQVYVIIGSSISDTIADQIPIQFILSEYLSGVFDPDDLPKPEEPEEEPDEEPEEEPEEEQDDEDIPVVPIERPEEKMESGNDFLDSNEIQSFDELKKKKEAIKINKTDTINDSESEESEDESEDESEEETKKETSTLF